MEGSEILLPEGTRQVDSSGSQANAPQSQLDFISTTQPPLEMKSIEILPDGRIQCNTPDIIEFNFEYYGLLFHGTVNRGNEPAQLTLTSDMGPLPYSSSLPGLRQNIKTVMAAANEFGRTQFTVTAEQRMTLAGAIEVDAPVSAGALLVAATEFLLSIKPVLDMMAFLLAEGESNLAKI